jgi:hypothetical protein
VSSPHNLKEANDRLLPAGRHRIVARQATRAKEGSDSSAVVRDLVTSCLPDCSRRDVRGK